MKVILDITQSSRIPFFMEILNSLSYVKVIKKIDEKEKNQTIDDLTSAFDEVRLHEEGKIKLSSARDFLHEL
ncbi:MAG: hypothetical protein ACK5LR_05490 [Mangrovibacterium sp.]